MLAKVCTVSFVCSLLLFSVGCQQESEVETGAAAPVVNSNAQSETSIETSEQEAARLLATFPAQQRAPADSDVIARGNAIFEINCRSCHGADLRGGDLGGPNLLRSPLVLNDEDGELIIPVVQQGKRTPGMTEMPALNLPLEDIEAVAIYIHSVVSTSRGQGAPPAGAAVELNILVGDAAAGKSYFDAQCSDCHSATGDLQGIATQISSPATIQDTWVSGRRRGPPGPNADPQRRQVIATVTLSTGELISGELKRRDDFILSLTTEDGQHRSFTLRANDPEIASIEVDDPMQRHLKLLSEYTDDIMHNVTAYLVTLK